MREIVLIAGLPGSGKTVLGQKLSEQNGYAFLDDASRSLGSTGFEEHMGRYAHMDGLVIADPMLCAQGALENARGLLRKIFPGVPVRVIAFENDPEQCRANVRLRSDGRAVLELIRALSAVWSPQDIADCEIRSVYSSSCKA